MTNEEIQNIFLMECEEGLQTAESGLMDCQSGNADPESINSVFRAVHSIKGGAGAFGFSSLQAFTHIFETVLQQVRDGDKELDDTILRTLLTAFDMLSDHVAFIRGEAEEPDDTNIAKELEDIAGVEGDPSASDEADEISAGDDEDGLSEEGEPDFDSLLADLDFDLPSDDEANSETAGWVLSIKPKITAMQNGGEPLRVIRELSKLGGVVTDINLNNVPLLDAFEIDQPYLSWNMEFSSDVDQSDVDEIFDFIDEDYDLHSDHNEKKETSNASVETLEKEAPVQETKKDEEVEKEIVAKEPEKPSPAAKKPPAAKSIAAIPQTIRVDLEKLDRLVDTVGELVITQAMLTERLEGTSVVADDELAQFEYLTRELQDCSMSLRAQPVSSVFSRIPRIVREVEGQTGKKVTLIVEGENTELDKTVIERIGEPLTHLIRNAVDHGIEPPDERLENGKSEDGQLTVAAEHRNGRIVIEVRDDGRGINRKKVRQIAIEKEIINEDTKMDDEEIDNLIFAPGFSTSQTVSNISGRGVGMDVVRQNIQALGGRVSIVSTPGEGSVFTLTLPLTLAIADGMVVEVGGEQLVVPLTHIIESLRPKKEQINKLNNGQKMLNVRGDYLPIVSLGEALSYASKANNPEDSVLIIVETEKHGQVVLMVDAICDQRQIVIKSLETNFCQIPGIAGATILGDGRIALIAEVEALTSAYLSSSDYSEAA